MAVKEAEKKAGNKKSEKVRVKDTEFWIFICTLVLVGMVLIGTTVFRTPTLTGNAAVQTISLVREGASLHFEVRNIPCLKDATAVFSEDVKGGKIVFEEYTPNKFDGDMVCGFTISSEVATKIKSVDFTFKIHKDKISSINKLGLFKGDDSLQIKHTRDEGKYHFLTATSGSLGQFIIGEKEIVKIIPKKVVQKDEEIKDDALEEDGSPKEEIKDGEQEVKKPEEEQPKSNPKEDKFPWSIIVLAVGFLAISKPSAKLKQKQ